MVRIGFSFRLCSAYVSTIPFIIYNPWQVRLESGEKVDFMDYDHVNTGQND